MAIQIEANYTKKLGLPNYSSHAYSVTVRTAVQNLEQIESESARLYGLLQSSVDREILKTGFLPGGNGSGAHHANGSNGSECAVGANRDDPDRLAMQWKTTRFDNDNHRGTAAEPGARGMDGSGTFWKRFENAEPAGSERDYQQVTDAIESMIEFVELARATASWHSAAGARVEREFYPTLNSGTSLPTSGHGISHHLIGFSHEPRNTGLVFRPARPSGYVIPNFTSFALVAERDSFGSTATIGRLFV